MIRSRSVKLDAVAVAGGVCLLLVLGCAVGHTCVELNGGDRFGIRAGACANSGERDLDRDDQEEGDHAPVPDSVRELRLPVSR